VDLKIRTLWGSRHLGFQDGGTEARTFFKVHMNKSSKVTTPFWGSWDSVKSSLTEIMSNLLNFEMFAVLLSRFFSTAMPQNVYQNKKIPNVFGCNLSKHRPL